jgi:hypothetical protein
MEQLGAHWTDFHDIVYLIIFQKKLSRKFKFHWNIGITRTSPEDRYTYMIVPHSILRRVQNVWDNCCIENWNTHFVFSKFFFYLALYEIMWKNTVETKRPQMSIWHLCFACWVHNARDTHWKYVILIAFPLQQWLHEHVWILRYTYVPCLVGLCSQPVFNPYPANVENTVSS